MQASGIVLATNVAVVAATSGFNWVGGKSAIVLIAGTYPTTCQLQCLAPDNATWIPINSSTFNANQVTAYDLPAGQYRLYMTGGSVAGLYASLIRVPYG